MRRAMMATEQRSIILASLPGATGPSVLRNCKARVRYVGAILAEFRRALLAEQCYADLKYARRGRVPYGDIPRIVFARLYIVFARLYEDRSLQRSRTLWR